MMHVKEHSHDIYYCDYQDCELRSAEIQTSLFLAYLLLYAEFECELTTDRLAEYDQIATRYRDRARLIAPHAYADRMFPQRNSKS